MPNGKTNSMETEQEKHLRCVRIKHESLLTDLVGRRIVKGVDDQWLN